MTARFLEPGLRRHIGAGRAGLALAIGLGALGGALTIGQACALSRAVNDVFLGSQGLDSIRPWLLILAGLALARAAASWAADVAASLAAQRIKTTLRERLAAHILALGPFYTRGERTGELVNTALAGVETLDAYISQYLPQLALAAIVPVLFLLFIFPIDPLTGLVLLVTAPLIPLFMSLIGSLADALTRRQWTALSRMSAHFLDVLQGLSTLKLFNRSREQIAVIRQISNQHRDATLSVLRVAFLSALVLEMVGTIGTAIVAVEIGLRLLYGRLAFEQAFYVLILAPEFYLPLRLLGIRFHAGMAGAAAAQSILHVLAASPSGAAPATGSECGQADASLSGPLAISFQGVSYGYAERTVDALHDVTFDIPAGETVALVGPSGSGKSTVAALLLHFAEPTRGQITANGRPLSAVPVNVWRRQVAWVPQMPYLFDATVADNIRLGRPLATMDEIVQAAQAAGADGFIHALPHGYHTMIGERGARLSGGQAQRIALARAFLTKAPVVVCDEATANLDPETAAGVQASLDRLRQRCTMLIIAHQLSTVRCAGRIVVLEAGRVAETGTHDELMSHHGVYRRLVSAYDEAGWIDRVEGDHWLQQPLVVQHESWLPADPVLPSLSPPAAGAVLRRLALGSEVRRPLSSPRSVANTGAVLRRLAGFLSGSWRWMALAVLLGFLTIGSSVGLLALSAWIIAQAALRPSIAVLQAAIVGVRFFGITRGLCRYLERLVSHQVAFGVLAQIRVWFYAAIEPLAPARLAAYHSGDLLSRIVSDIAVLENFYLRAVAPPLVALLVAGLLGAILGSYDPRLAPPALALFALAGVGAPLLAQILSHRPGRRLAQDTARLTAAVVEGMQGAADLLAFGAEQAHVARVRSLSRALGQTQATMAAISALSSALCSLLTWLAVVAIVIVAAPLVEAGGLAGVDLPVLCLAALAAFEAVLPLPLAAQYLEASLAAARRLVEIVGESQPQLSGVAEPAHADRPRPPAIDIRDLTMRYAPGEPAALQGVTLAVPAGGRVAIVGSSGAGKSTLAAVLLRFWDYEAGQVCLDGRDVRQMDPETTRRQIGMVAQQPYLFNATVRDNLLLARPHATREELEQAARVAHVHDTIMALPHGYDTWIGEQGLKLSGGERQRLAIARALLKDAPILILDEPAANLDPETERMVWDALQPLMAGRTTIVITHRPTGLQGMDCVYVLDQGRVVEHGSHAALLACDGLYRRLWHGVTRVE